MQTIITNQLQALKQRIAANIVASGQSTTGTTIQNLQITTTQTGATLSAPTHFGTLQAGRAPGSTPQNFTQIIQQWMAHKGITAPPIPYLRTPSQNWKPKYTPQQRGDYSLAGAIAHKIQTEGTTLFRSGGSTAIYTAEIPQTITNLQKQLAAHYAAQFKNLITN